MTLEQRSPVLKVAIVSHNNLLLLELRRIFEERDRILVVGESSGGNTAYNLITQQRPDVILVDIESDIKSAEAINDLRQNNPLSRIIVLSGWDEMDRARQALAAGTDEIVMKCQQPEVLLATVEGVGKGGKGLAGALKATSNQPLVTTKVDKRKAVTDPSRCTDAVTDREREVIVLVGGVCTGAVKVSGPHSMGKGRPRSTMARCTIPRIARFERASDISRGCHLI